MGRIKRLGKELSLTGFISLWPSRVSLHLNKVLILGGGPALHRHALIRITDGGGKWRPPHFCAYFNPFIPIDSFHFSSAFPLFQLRTIGVQADRQGRVMGGDDESVVSLIFCLLDRFHKLILALIFFLREVFKKMALLDMNKSFIMNFFFYPPLQEYLFT